MTIPLPPVPGPEIAPRSMLTPPWHSWFNQLYVYLTQPSSGGGGIVSASRKINTTAPLAGGGTLAADLTLSVTANGVTNAFLAQMSGNTLKGNNTGVLATPVDLTVAQAQTLLVVPTNANPLAVNAGGTGLTSYTIGDILYASAATTLAKLSDVASGSYLRAGGVGAAPLWSTATIPNSATLGDVWYGSAANVISALGGNTSATKNFLTQTGTGTVSAAPAWGTLAVGDLPNNGANPATNIGLSVVNGSATTWMRSDGAPALSQSITPTWTAAHIWSSTMAASANPLTAATTRVQTGLAAYKPSDTTSANNTLTADSTLQLTFNETGKYAIEIWLPFYEASVGTGGFQFDLGSGTATVANLVMGVDGFSTASVINAGITSTTTASSAASVATSATAPSWFFAKGSLSITGTGTLAVRWAQASTLGADPTTLKQGAYFMATKIG